MISKYNLLFICVVLTAIVCCLTTIVEDKSSDNKKYFNYLRLPEGQCYNCSTYKCTNHKANLGGSEWCIMLFNNALAHCDSDPNCGGYTMTTAKWFHEKHDKNGQIAVHLTKFGEKSMICPIPEWSSYEKQVSTRSTPVIYGRSTCDNSDENTCQKSHNFNYVFVNNSNVVNTESPYLCNNHPNKFDKNDVNCILPITDAVTLCNSDNQCKGFMIKTEENWQKKSLVNGIQAAQLFGHEQSYSPGQTWRIFTKQY